LAAVVTATDRDGKFLADLPTSGEYYVSISRGTQEVYGRVMNIAGNSHLAIYLNTSGMTGFPQPCSIVSSNLLRRTRPVALAALPSGMLVLDSDNARLLQLGSENISVVINLHAYASFELFDMAATRSPSGADVVCVLVNPPPGAHQMPGFVSQYVNRAKLPRVWSVPGPSEPITFAGITIDNQQQVAYVGHGHRDAFILYRLTLTHGTAILTEVMSWPTATAQKAIGPMVVDSGGRKLFAADQREGKLYRINLDNMAERSEVGLRGVDGKENASLGTPLALALAGTGDTLYVAASKHLWAVHLNTQPAQLEEPWRNQRFDGLSAVAADSDGNVWAADVERHAIYEFAPSGELLRTYR
jgi:hypothetical protein